MHGWPVHKTLCMCVYVCVWGEGGYKIIQKIVRGLHGSSWLSPPHSSIIMVKGHLTLTGNIDNRSILCSIIYQACRKQI